VGRCGLRNGAVQRLRPCRRLPENPKRLPKEPLRCCPGEGSTRPNGPSSATLQRPL
jgi:hypothetical protein